ncbi:unnamed protein product [Nyctereutes procyonoides]|uniref:(raccoon dog) hypothetical protein n=1 Tax=Nyctereutes procyonoides TaxID=34880 RepID=A0A811ZZ58_NYCPR|nr:unnamed protein product [Nyctereutes procyonoides]
MSSECKPWGTVEACLSTGLFECPHNMAAGFPQNEGSKRQRQKQQYLLSWKLDAVTSMVDKICLKWPLRAGLIHRIKVTAVELKGEPQKAEVLQEKGTPSKKEALSQSGRSEDWYGSRFVLRACWRSWHSVVDVQ